MRTRPTAAALAVLSLAALVSGCGDDEDDASLRAQPAAAVPVDRAVEHIDEIAEVEGFLLAADGEEPLLCSALAESFPPQCGGHRLTVPELDVDRVADGSPLYETTGDLRVRWSTTVVSLIGRVGATALDLLGEDQAVDAGWVVVTAVSRGDHPLHGVDVELWQVDGGLSPALGATTDALGHAAFHVPSGTYRAVALPVPGYATPSAVDVTSGPAGGAVTLEYPPRDAEDDARDPHETQLREPERHEIRTETQP